jgi:hypothetical protein
MKMSNCRLLPTYADATAILLVANSNLIFDAKQTTHGCAIITLAVISTYHIYWEKTCANFAHPNFQVVIRNSSSVRIRFKIDSIQISTWEEVEIWMSLLLCSETLVPMFQVGFQGSITSSQEARDGRNVK